MHVSPLWRLLAPAAVACLPATLLSQTTRGAPSRPEVARLTITGVKSVPKNELEENLAIEASHCRSTPLVPVCWISKSPIFFQRAYLDHDELARDVIRARVFYYLRGYRETTVDTVVRPAGKHRVWVTLAVHEGPPTVVSTLQVNQTVSVLNPHDVRTRLSLHPGRALNLLELDSTRVNLRNRLWEKGYADAIVDTSTVVDTVTRQAVVVIRVEPRWVARVGDIRVEGNQDVSRRTILKSLSFHTGDIYRRNDVLESQRTLYESNLFRRASIATPRRSALVRDSILRDTLGRDPFARDSLRRLARARDSLGRGSPDSVKLVTITVQEAPPRLMRVSAGFNTVDFVQLEGRYTNYDWLGGARQLTTLVTVGNLLARQLNGTGIFYDVSKTVVGAGAGKYFLPSFEASGELRQPWFGSPRNDIALSLFTHRRIAPGIYVDRGYGASGTFTRRLTTRGPASLTYRFEVTNVDAGDVYFCISYGVCDAPTLAALRKNQKLSPLTVSASLDQADDPYEPRRGYRAELNVEHATAYTLSDFRYDRVTGNTALYLPLGKKSVLAGHLRAGYVQALASTAEAVGATLDSSPGADTRHILHPRKRFYLGGATSVRGFVENQLGPRVLTIAPEKLRGSPSSASASVCPSTTPIAQCDPNASYISNNDFDPRPLGGNLLLEGSTEYRFPVFGSFLGAVFVDAGYLAQNTNPTLARSEAAVTPGFGGRYLSPVGPVRVDIGINPIISEKLPVVTEDFVNGQRTLVTLQQRRTYQTGHGLLSRLTLHLAIGEAY